MKFGKKYADIIIGRLNNDEKAENKISQWCEIAKKSPSFRLYYTTNGVKYQ